MCWNDTPVEDKQDSPMWKSILRTIIGLILAFSFFVALGYADERDKRYGETPKSRKTRVKPVESKKDDRNIHEKFVDGLERRSNAHAEVLGALFPSEPKCHISMDDYYRPRCDRHGYSHHDWNGNVGVFARFSLPHLIVIRDGYAYCTHRGHNGYGCPYIWQNDYYQSYRSREIIERSHMIWDATAGGYSYAPGFLPGEPEVGYRIMSGAEYRSATPQLMFGPQPDENTATGRVVCLEHNRSPNCPLVTEITGGLQRVIGTAVGPDGQRHTLYCPEGARCPSAY